MNEQQQLIALRSKLFKICPQMQNQILTMNKQDLQQLLGIIGSNKNYEKANSVSSSQKQSQTAKAKTRSLMISDLIQMSPDIGIQELKQLSDADIEEIYFKYKEKFDLKKKNQELKNKDSRKRKVIQNGEVNVYEMKRILIDKLPEYRNDIRNLPDDDIKKMFKQLQSKSQSSGHQMERGMGRQYRQPVYPNYAPQPLMPIDPMGDSMMGQISNMSKMMPMRQDEEESFYETQMSNLQSGIDGVRKRGRPRKVRDMMGGGFTYDNAPNYGGAPNYSMDPMQKSYDYAPDYSMMDYSNSKFDIESQSNFPNSSLEPGLTPYKQPKPIQQIGYDMPSASIDYHGNKIQQPQFKSHTKHQKQMSVGNRKCKITFYLDYSDLEDSSQEEERKQQRKQQSKQVKVNENAKPGNPENGTEGQNKEQNKKKDQGSMQEKQKIEKEKIEKRKNKLATIIETMYQAFGKKTWKIQ